MFPAIHVVDDGDRFRRWTLVLFCKPLPFSLTIKFFALHLYPFALDLFFCLLSYNILLHMKDIEALPPLRKLV